MLTRLNAFVDRLRQAGVGVSTAEVIDASDCVLVAGVANREQLRSALACSLVKNSAHLPIFDTMFDLYFPGSLTTGREGEHPEEQLASSIIDRDQIRTDLVTALLQALREMDSDALDRLAAEAVRRFAGMQPGRPAGGRLYESKVEAALDLYGLSGEIAEGLAGGSEAAPGPLAGRLAEAEARARIADFRRRVRQIIRRALLEDRGPEALARALVPQPPEDAPFLQASPEQLAEMRRTVEALARKLASRLTFKHHRSRTGRLDFRRTIRHSLETGGTPLVPKMRHRVRRPEIVLLSDLSGSVAAFSRFALALVYTLSSHFGKVRSFAFIDALDEVTGYFKEGSDLGEATSRIRSEARLVWLDGHSDYGHSLKQFVDEYSDALTPRTTVLILGDCRSNWTDPGVAYLDAMKSKVRNLFVLNPESSRFWDTGDSIVSVYRQHCDGIFECRNLRELSAFIERIG